MVFSKSTKEMWIASENLVHRIPVEVSENNNIYITTILKYYFFLDKRYIICSI